jgi:ribonuclease R
MGADSGRVIALGQRVQARLVEAVPVTGGLMLEPLEIAGETVEGGAMPDGARGGPRKSRGKGKPGRKGAPPGRKPAAGKAAKAGDKRKVSRRRK